MTWLIITQLIILCFLSYNNEKLKSTATLRLSWHWFSAVFFSQAALTLFRVNSFGDIDYPLVEIWANGFTWLSLGMSIFQLPSLFIGEDSKKPNQLS